jgi:hypothetical protein
MLRVPDDALYAQLHGVVPDVRLLGDALAPRGHLEILHEAEQVARSL